MLKGERGGVTLEAALLLPFFLAFVLTLATLIRLAVAEMALHAAAAETTKMIASHLYPVGLLLEEAKSKFGESRIGQGIYEVLDRAESARNGIEQAEQFVDDYAAWIPEPVVQFVLWEKELRESVSEQSGDAWEAYRKRVLDPKLFALMKPVVRLFSDMETLDEDRLQVVGVDWPSFADREHAYLSIELSYKFPIRLPFFTRNIEIRKKSYERVWLGA